MKVAIVKYNAGNVESVKNSLLRLGVKPMLSDVPDELLAADKVIFPGVGEANSAMAALRDKGLDGTLRSLTQPVLAICLGMQLLGTWSEENDTDCLGIMPFNVRRFPDVKIKVPHIGWNNISNLRTRLFDGITEHDRMYFVHSYYVKINSHVTAVADYGLNFCAALSHENFHAVQFHPEKSGRVGSKVLENFLNI